MHAFRLVLFGTSFGHNSKVEAVVHRMPKVLLAAQVSFGRLHRGVPEQKLNLFDLAATRMAQLRARSPQIVRRDALQPRFFAAPLYHVPDHVLGDRFAPNLSGPAHSPKNLSVPDPGSLRPLVERPLRPSRNRNRANVPTLADQIHDGPVLLPLLHIAHLQPDQLGSAESTTKKQREHGIVAFLTHAVASGAA